ncbi:UDP-3-O-acyl-N-acetylglucosamine deacetylase [Desulfovibrio sp. OttesenSCG-928-A18]|nr:UDP-3-O-acyl-N-acetylglucosamine deacetylase [Desulfovibrio sp. OttesenSCG-928-A18]
MRQTTIGHRVSCEGIGLHSGKKVTLAMRPAAEDTGIVFHVHAADEIHDITPSPDAVIATGLATTLGKNGASVSTVEHLLAALRGLGIDNVHIDVKGGEVPIMDGSAAPFVMMLSEAGVHTQKKARRVLRIKKSMRLEHKGKSILAEPGNGFYVDYAIDFPHPLIGTQRMSLDLTPASFARVAKARTFGFLRDAEMLKERGLALGGSLDNAIVLDEQGVVNTEGLRCDDEFVRHKLLDFIGDMAMLPLPLQGRFTVSCSGHGLNNEFLRHIYATPSLYLEEVRLPDAFSRPEGRPLRAPLDRLHAPAYAG